MLKIIFSITKTALCQPPGYGGVDSRYCARRKAYATVTPQILGRQAPLISRKLNTWQVREMGRSKGRR